MRRWLILFLVAVLLALATPSSAADVYARSGRLTTSALSTTGGTAVYSQNSLCINRLAALYVSPEGTGSVTFRMERRSSKATSPTHRGVTAMPYSSANTLLNSDGTGTLVVWPAYGCYRVAMTVGTSMDFYYEWVPAYGSN